MIFVCYALKRAIEMAENLNIVELVPCCESIQRKAAMNDFEHDLLRRQNGRQGYIAWRMSDLPPIYQNLMPVSYKVKTLREAERAIRAQYLEDLKMAETPWRTIGPVCKMLDLSELTATEKMAFGLENEPFAGFDNIRPRPGREKDLTEELKEGTRRWMAENPGRVQAENDFKPPLDMAQNDLDQP